MFSFLTHGCESLWLIERGAVKQWEMTSLLCAHCLPANRAGARVRSFDYRQKKHDNKWQNSHGARLQKQLQTALILFVTFI